MPNILQNGSRFIREGAPLEEPKLEPFLKEPELCQTDLITELVCKLRDESNEPNYPSFSFNVVLL